MGDDLEMVAVSLISQAGEARSLTLAALDALIAGDLAEVERLLDQADRALADAHSAHASFLQREAKGEVGPPTYLLAHALDILMAAVSERDLAKRIVALEARHRAESGGASEC